MSKRVSLAIACLFVAAAASIATPQAHAAESEWIIGAERAKDLVETGAATILDTRGESPYAAGHLPGAVAVDWEAFTPDAGSKKGALIDDQEALSKKLQELGVSKNEPVVVVGNPPDNWGEDGRIVWMLRALGHPKAMLVDGGHDAVEGAGVESTTDDPDIEAGDFEVASSAGYRINAPALRNNLNDDAYVIVDTREEREFEGQTPYGESRGGHVPGAKHLHYTDLMRSDGRLLPESKIRDKLAARGIAPDKKVVAYCTGGVRSAWLVVVLAHLGYSSAMNYPGSMWDWAARDAEKYPLEK